MTEGEKSRKPANTAFKQQRLKAWQPILTPKTVLPTFFIVGIIFAPLGGLLLYASDRVSELTIDYTDCFQNAPTEDGFELMPTKNVRASFPSAGSKSPEQPSWRLKTGLDVPAGGVGNGTISDAKQCQIRFSIPVDLKPPVFLYYRLTNFYQNHRRYVKSFDPNQLKGEAVSAGTLRNGNCKPLDMEKEAKGSPDKIIYPCGLIANSIFNDTFSDLLDADGTATKYNFSNKGIAWPTDAQKYGPTQYQLSQIVPPPNWALRYPDGYTEDNPPPNLKDDEAFQVWMRTAGLPDFRKLSGKNQHDTLKEGQYQINVNLFFPVDQFDGTKSVVISTVSFLGGKNPFLGIAYIAIGILCVLLGCIFTARHLYKPRKLGDHTYLSWNQDNTKNSKTSGGRD